MSRNLRALGLAVFAVLAIGALVAPAAQAEPTITSGVTPNTHTATSVHATQYDPTSNITDNRLTTGVGSFHCSNSLSTFTGATTGTNKTLTLTPTYTHCTTITAEDKAGTPLTVIMNGCDYLVNQLSTIGDGSGRYTGTVNLVCPAGKSIEILSYASGTVTAHSIKICTVVISETKNLSHVISQNKTGGTYDDITVTVAVSGIPYTTSGICGVTAGNATYASSLTLTSNTDDLWLSD